MIRNLPGNNDFVAYIDAIGTLDGTELFDRLEDYDEPVSGRAGRTVDTRPSAHLLFLDQRHSGCGPGGVRTKAATRRFST